MIDELIPILVPGFFFLAVAVPIVVAIRYRHKRFREHQETIRLMIDKGLDVPDKLLNTYPQQLPSKKNDLRKGVLLITTGLGVTLFLALASGSSDGNGWSVGLIPLAIGIGYIINWKLSDDKPEAIPGSEPEVAKV